MQFTRILRAGAAPIIVATWFGCASASHHTTDYADSGLRTDATTSTDAASPIDSGSDTGLDSGLDSGSDAGLANDAGYDAGVSIDSGVGGDAGPTMDSGVGVDAGMHLVSTAGHYQRTCDGSGGVALDGTHFLDVNDEDQVVRIYTQGANAVPVQTVDINSAIGLSSGDEADLEEAARVGNRVYVVASHGRDKNGNLEPMRYRFFALDVTGTVPSATLTVTGTDTNLLSDLLNASNWVTPDSAVISLIDARSMLNTATDSNLAPKVNGTNVEGLAWLPTEGHPNRLVLGFRNPLISSKAILVTLLNPDQVLAGATAQFGQAFQFDLGGYGIRSLAWSTEHQAIFLISGPTSGANGPYALWKWDELSSTTPTKVMDLTGFPSSSAPEAIIAYPGTTDLQILYDQGSFQIGGNDCKSVSAGSQYFTDRILVSVP